MPLDLFPASRAVAPSRGTEAFAFRSPIFRALIFGGPKTIILSIALLLAASAPAHASPFSVDDYSPTHSDRGYVHYELTRAELAGASICTAGTTLTDKNCVTGIHRFCESRGHLSGYGFESASSSNDVEILCLGPGSGKVLRGKLHTEFPTVGTCPGTLTPDDLNCAISVDRYCRNSAEGDFIGGFGPVESNATLAAVTCIADDPGQVFLGVAPAGGNQLASCFPSASVFSAGCRQALDDYCVDQQAGLRGGFGPAEYNLSPQKMRIGCVDEDLPWVANSSLPPEPLLPIDILDQKIKTTALQFEPTKVHNSLMGYRGMTYDGRIFIRPFDGKMSFQVQAPEIFESPISQEPVVNKDRSYADNGYYAFDVALSEFHNASPDDGVITPNSTVLCDPHDPDNPASVLSTTNRQQAVPARTSNPYTCNASGTASSNGDHDCYSVTVVSVYKRTPETAQDEIWARPVIIVVESPKLSVPNNLLFDPDRADVLTVIFPQDGNGVALPAVQAPDFAMETVKALEPVMTGDGRLLVMQGANHELMYAHIPETADACDITQLSAFKHIHEMHEDTAVADYGIAVYPMRDSEGNVLDPDLAVDPIRGGYPWMDRDGDNLIFTPGRAPLFYSEPNSAVVESRYEVLAHPSSYFTGNLEPPSTGDIKDYSEKLPRIGLSVVGLWTHGKIVTPDIRNNNVDLGIPDGPGSHRMLDLYDGVVGGTEVGSSLRTKINSTENQFFMLPNLRPDTPREVVWTISSQTQTDELAFDDMMDPRALIVSPMGASIDNTGNDFGHYRNGFVSINPGSFEGEGFKEPSHIANHATSVSQAVADNAEVNLSSNVQWNVPAYGLLLGGARTEPIAAGGHDHRGLWLDGDDDRLDYLIPDQPTATASDFDDATWFVHIAINPGDMLVPRRLLTLPDTTYLEVEDSDTLVISHYALGSSDILQLNLPTELALSSQKWTSLGLVSRPATGGGQEIDVYVDGHLLTASPTATPYARMRPGIFRVGAASAGFEGWVDELKVLSYEPTPEVVCNHARGTFIRVESGDSQALLDLADAYPASSHQRIGNMLPDQPVGEEYICERPIDQPQDIYDADDHSNYHCLFQTRRLSSVTDPDKCLRDHLLLHPVVPPLYWDEPKPSFVNAPFCLSCHVGSHPSDTLDITNALSAHSMSLDLVDDERRQPMQVPPEINGNIPASYFGTLPMIHTHAPATGEPLDPFVTPESP